MNRVLVKVFFPQIDKWYETWIPLNKTISNVIKLLLQGVNELNENVYPIEKSHILYNRKTVNYYELNTIVSYTDIKNGTELILI